MRCCYWCKRMHEPQNEWWACQWWPLLLVTLWKALCLHKHCCHKSKLEWNSIARYLSIQITVIYAKKKRTGKADNDYQNDYNDSFQKNVFHKTQISSRGKTCKACSNFRVILHLKTFCIPPNSKVGNALTRHNLINVSKSLQTERGYNMGFACIFQVPIWASPLCQDKPTCSQRYWLLLVRCQDIRCLIWNLIFISAVISLAIKDRFFLFHLLNTDFVSCFFFKKQGKCFYLIFKFNLISDLFHAKDAIQESTKSL